MNKPEAIQKQTARILERISEILEDINGILLELDPATQQKFVKPFGRLYHQMERVKSLQIQNGGKEE